MVKAPIAQILLTIQAAFACVSLSVRSQDQEMVSCNAGTKNRDVFVTDRSERSYYIDSVSMRRSLHDILDYQIRTSQR